MKIVATDDQLTAVKYYDLGTRPSEGPDHEAFNADITTKSDLYYMEVSEYARLLRARARGDREASDDAKARKSALRSV